MPKFRSKIFSGFGALISPRTATPPSPATAIRNGMGPPDCWVSEYMCQPFAISA
jgi:hypothetical protein